MTDHLLSPVAALDSQAPARLMLDDGPEHKTEYAFQGHGFALDKLGILIPPQARCEVVEGLQVCPLPGAADWFLGMAQLRGYILPVFDLQRLALGSGTAPQRLRRFLVLEPQQKGLAVLLPAMPKRLQFSLQQQMDNQAGVPPRLLSHCRNLFYDNGLWLELDFDGLFSQMTKQLVVTH